MTLTELKGEMPIQSESDLVLVRRAIREAATQAGFGSTDVTRIVTASSEMARNMFKYAGEGTVQWRGIDRGNNSGIELQFEDHGPGISNVNLALQEGYTTGDGLGMGLSGARRLMNELEIQSVVGQGTKITLRKWLKRLQ